ncbi:hypothetical protein B2G67_01090 [Microbacterium foliorum]|nr:hypothetical protein B2G67_01090 [Microbacterium foliorum]
MDISIRPEVNILAVLRHLNYKPWFALAEFVDNSLGSAIRAGYSAEDQPLKVVIDFDAADGGRIVIRDNAAGIAVEDFGRAFRAAHVPPDRTGLSEFGMGMKSAASWFARKWTVTTSTDGDPVERRVTFDIEDIQTHMRDKLSVAEIETNIESHFTTVELVGLNHLPQTKTLVKIKEHLSSIYREFLRSGFMQLSFRGEKLSFNEVDPLVAVPVAGGGEPVLWHKPIDFTLQTGQRVSGFAALRAKGSTAEAGFALLRRQRLIMGSADETYRPVEIFGRSTTHTYQRLYGELSLEGFEISHTKDGFRWDEYEDSLLTELKTALSEKPLDLLSQAANYRLQPIVDHRKKVEDAVEQVAAVVQGHFEDAAEQIMARESKEAETALPGVAPAYGSSVRRRSQVDVDGETWFIDLEATLEDGIVDWIAVGAEFDTNGATVIEVSLSLAHPLSRKFVGPSNENAESILTFASLIGLALALGKRSGAKSQSIVNRVNQLARSTFSTIETSN